MQQATVNLFADMGVQPGDAADRACRRPPRPTRRHRRSATTATADVDRHGGQPGHGQRARPPTPAAGASAASRSRSTAAPAGIPPTGRESWSYTLDAAPPAASVTVRAAPPTTAATSRAARPAGGGGLGGGAAGAGRRRRRGGGPARAPAACRRRRPAACACRAGGRVALRVRCPPARAALPGPTAAAARAPAASASQDVHRGRRQEPAASALQPDALGAPRELARRALAARHRRRPSRATRPATAPRPRTRSACCARGGAERDTASDRDAARARRSRSRVTSPGRPAPPRPCAPPGRGRAARSSSSPTRRDPFGRYYAEILRAEGLNEFAVADIGQRSRRRRSAATTSSSWRRRRDARRRSRCSATWVAGRRQPDRDAAGPAARRPARARTDTRRPRERLPAGRHRLGARRGITGDDDAVPRHRRPLTPGRRDARSRRSTATRDDARRRNPAVTLRSVGAAGGQAAAFTYDLARSVVYTRQGNPAWAGQERDGQTRRSAPTTCSSAARSRLGRPRQGRDPAGRRAAAAAGEPDHADERSTASRCRASGTSRAARRPPSS